MSNVKTQNAKYRSSVTYVSKRNPW